MSTGSWAAGWCWWRVGRRRGVLAGWLALLLVVYAAVVGAGVLGPRSGSGAAGGVGAHLGWGLGVLPAAAWGPVSAVLGRDDAAYGVRGLAAVNPAQRLRLRFTSAGVDVGVGSARAEVSLGLQGVGRGGALVRVGRVRPRVLGNRVSYTIGGVQEWFVNGPLGVEQGFDLAQRPAGRRALVMSMGLSGARGVHLGRAGVVVISLADGSLRYAAVSATDARGRALPARLTVADGRLSLDIDDRGARYPVRVDPFIQQGAKLVGSGYTGTPWQGSHVALSADGSTAVIGGPFDNGRVGAAWVFTRSGSTWTQQGAKLVGSGYIGTPWQGSSVALSADGSTALIGGPLDNGRVGAAWMLTRSGSTWTQQGAKLVGSGYIGTPLQGSYVALSADGSTALIGGPADDHLVGAAWVFTRAGSTWTQQGAKLVGSPHTGHPLEANMVALSADGNTALIAGPYENGFVGATWVFARSGSTWTQGAELVGSGYTGYPDEGSSVALSADGNTALIGGIGDNGFVGAAWVFARSGSTWTQGAELVGQRRERRR